MYLETERCIIRKFTLDDASDMFPILSDAEVMKYIETTFDSEKTLRFIEKYGACENPLVYAAVLRETGRVIGHIIYHPYDETSYEIGWVLSRAYWGRGIADEITKALVEHSKDKAESCVIECDESQKISCHIALKNGFKYESGQDGLVTYRLKLK